MDRQNIPPRGRGALIAAVLKNKKAQESKPGSSEDAPSTSEAEVMERQNVPPRGRGALIAAALKSKKAQESKPGSSGDAPSTSEPEVMERQNVPPRGRGALIAAVLKNIKAQESKPGSSGDATSTSEAEPPRPRGRAALLATLRKNLEVQVGSHEPSKSISQTVITPVEKLEKTPCEYRGESGTEVPASANYIRLKLEPNRGVFEYEVRFNPNVDAKSARFKMLNSALGEYGTAKTFDGHSLYLPIRLFEVQKEFALQHPFNDEETITMSIIFKKQKKTSECIQLYNILFKRIMHALKYMRVGRNFFDNVNTFLIPQHKLEVWPGYVAAVDEFSGGILLCLDVQSRVLRTQTALQFMYEAIEENKKRYKQICEKALIGSAVLTRYNNKTYIVHDIEWEASPLSVFDTASGPLSFKDYYKIHYNITITDMEQPLLVNRQQVVNKDKSGKDDRIIMLVPELCFMTGLRDEMRSDFRLMKDLAQFTRITPNQRMNALRKYINSVENTPEAKEILSAWGLSIDQATIDLKMRVLDRETILFGEDVRIHGTPQADWTSAAMKNRVITAVDLKKWLVIHTGQDKRFTEEYVQCMMRLGPRMGIYIERPMLYCMPDDRNETYFRVLQEKIVSDLQILVVICPTNRDDRYSTIKKICCSKHPIPSQVINSRTLRNPTKLPSITQKIALQMNCKMGGTLWSVRFPFKNWMICGIDIYHSKTISNQSVCGFVTNLNEIMSRWYSTICFHDKDKEIGDHLKVLFVKALNEYKANNGSHPTQIVIYRDGVGDGQLAYCQNYEIPQFLSAIKEMKINSKLIYIIVQKRVNTRVFARTKESMENPPPGSIIDHTITRKFLYDFFLVPQHVNQGTVTPTHYIVLYDDAHMKPDHIQRLSYKLCHMYYNWTGTIRVPAPCQYAHKLAYLIGQNVRAEHSSILAKRLFYL